MGLMDRLRREPVDLIEWLDDSRADLGWRFPRPHAEIGPGARLIVRPGQVALFTHHGQIADTFSPGRYTLTADNLPRLGNLLGRPPDAHAAFRSTVYFVSTQTVTDLRWATAQPIEVVGLNEGTVSVAASGLCVVRVLDANLFLRRVLQDSPDADIAEAAELLRRVITVTFTELVRALPLSDADLPGRQAELGAHLRHLVAPQVDDAYGLAIDDITATLQLSPAP